MKVQKSGIMTHIKRGKLIPPAAESLKIREIANVKGCQFVPSAIDIFQQRIVSQVERLNFVCFTAKIQKIGRAAQINIAHSVSFAVAVIGLRVIVAVSEP